VTYRVQSLSADLADAPSAWVAVAISILALVASAASAVMAILAYRMNRATAKAAGWIVVIDPPPEQYISYDSVARSVSNHGRSAVQITAAVLDFGDFSIPAKSDSPFLLGGGNHRPLPFSYSFDQSRIAERVDATLRVEAADRTTVTRVIPVPLPVRGPDSL
jgi:hypothetical protein